VRLAVASVPDFNRFPASAPIAPESVTAMEQFQKRLARLNSGAAARNVLWVGTEEFYEIPIRPKLVRKTGALGVVKNALYPVSMLGAVAVGFICHGIVLVARYQFVGLPDPTANPDIEMVSQIVMSYSLATVLGYFVGLRGRELMPLKSLGAALGLLLFHNLVHLYPQVFDVLCSKSWVNYVVTHTKAHSLVWRGISFVF
jgi:hypothetical protein